MSRHCLIRIRWTGLAVTVSLIASTVDAQYEISSYTVDGGGVTTSTSPNFQLAGTIGQADTGSMTGVNYQLSGGFWTNALLVVPGDCDGDGDTDYSDFTEFVDCVTGPGVDMNTDCYCADLTGDCQVGLTDFALWQVLLGNSL